MMYQLQRFCVDVSGDSVSGYNGMNCRVMENIKIPVFRASNRNLQ